MPVAAVRDVKKGNAATVAASGCWHSRRYENDAEKVNRHKKGYGYAVLNK